MHFKKRSSKVPDAPEEPVVTIVPLDEASQPPSYHQAEQAHTDLTAAFSHLDLSTTAELPTPDQCLAHLKLLEAFYALRQQIETLDGVFGIEDAFSPYPAGTSEHTKVASTIRQKRWAVFVSRAVARFERWWTFAIQPGAQRLKTDQMVDQLTKFVYDGHHLSFDVHGLPPLDVIMVWHSFHLNPRAFLEDCIRYGKTDFWRSGLPWAAIDSCIDNHHFTYTGSRFAMTSWTQKTGLSWNGLDDIDDAVVSCPKCRKDIGVPWTGYGRGGDVWKDKSVHELASGFADKSMSFTCPSCICYISHDELRLSKFWRDVVALIEDDLPMPGTILNVTGIPDPVFKREETNFPNRLLSCDLSIRERFFKVTKPGEGQSIEHVRVEIEALLENKETVMKAKNASVSFLTGHEKVAIRRMMSRYWDNSSPFALDLIGAVIRQGSFITKMHDIDWLHSPAVSSTISRLLVKYERYLKIIQENPRHTAVPTLDVDLAWHTHQLSAPAYYQYVQWNMEKFVDHDDKVDETRLSDAFEWTSKTYQKKYKEIYSECTCWYCAAVREAHDTSQGHKLKSTFGFKKASKPDTQLEILHGQNDGGLTGVHISTHSAIRPTQNDQHVKSQAHQNKLKHDYEAACQKAIKAGRTAPPPPLLENEEEKKKYGDPGVLLLYSVPVSTPDSRIDCDHYAANPACASFVQGGAGNCVAGTCGGGVAAGACVAGACAGGGASFDGGGGCSACSSF